jgi:hypothetical protein
MGANQIARMGPCLRAVYEGISGPDDAPTSCCTLDAINSSNTRVWIQAMPGTVNMAYPFTDEPLELLRSRGVRSPPDLYLVEWVAEEYATFGFNDVSARDHASFIDHLFVKILGCDDESYSLTTAIESLER